VSSLFTWAATCRDRRLAAGATENRRIVDAVEPAVQAGGLGARGGSTSAGAAGKPMMPRDTSPGQRERWAGVFDEIRRRLRACGLEEAMALGMVSDVSPSAEEAAFLHDVSGGLPYEAIWGALGEVSRDMPGFWDGAGRELRREATETGRAGFAASGWRERNLRLFRMAAEVQRRLD
jgi:hypothetical protein